MLSIEDAAQVMGMKPYREVREVVPVDGGTCVLTHDGRWTLIRPDGSMAFRVPAPPPPVDEPAPEPVQVDAVVLPDEVAVGSVDTVLAWVAGDSEDQVAARVAAALAVEQAREKPRATLLAALDKLQDPA